MLATRSGMGTFTTPSGHVIVADGGYRAVLGDATLALTSVPLLGWRDAPSVREVIAYETNEYIAIAERSLLVGVEAVLGAVEIVGGS